MSVDLPMRIRAPSRGCDIAKWTYREGNTRADEHAWMARRGQDHLTIDDRLSTMNASSVLGVIGFFDGGRSSEGYGGGWVLDLCILPLLPLHLSHLDGSASPSGFWWCSVASEAFCLPPSCAVAQAELLAAKHLLKGAVAVLQALGLLRPFCVRL
eukprot:4504371-Pyramimonas_sp.AAC.1